MQILGLFFIIAVVGYGFMTKSVATISYFDPHAMVIIVMGSVGATLLGSKPKDFLRTFISLKEFVPFLDSFGRKTDRMEAERKRLEDLWIAGKRSEAVSLGEKSAFSTTREMFNQVAGRASEALTENRFTALTHATVDQFEASISNWEMMAKLGPAFGMVGTITGMVQLFKNFSAGSSDLGSSMSLALLATLYGITFGAGIAGPIANFLNKLMLERVHVIERCEKTTRQLVNMRD